MPKQVDHRRRRDDIARAMWTVVDQRGWAGASLREVAAEAGMSLGQVQHYFASRNELLEFAVQAASDQTSRRVARGMEELGESPHPRDVVRLILLEMLPLHPDARPTSRIHAACMLEALHNESMREQIGSGMRDGRDGLKQLVTQAQANAQIDPDRDPDTETDLLLALTGFTPLLELGVVPPSDVIAAIETHLDNLFATT
ncbi:MAG: TetR/AcrR family transcriptional regulator [Galactobacter sp.]